MGTGDQPVPYLQPLLDAVSLFEELKLGYALIGGVAAMCYGRSRFTEDLDFVLVSGHLQTLTEHPDVMTRYHFDARCTRLYHDSGTDIDIWKDEYSDGVVARARSVQLAGRMIRVADPLDLIAMKLRAGRRQDDYDISQILREQTIDESALQSQVTSEQFNHFLEVKRRTGA